MSEPTRAGDLADGYAFSGPAPELGALLWDGKCLPGAPGSVSLAIAGPRPRLPGPRGPGTRLPHR
ncbi:hypothetical protein C6376_08680 [Streptomyces sp. P3]|nr:hypothetical protein C6376_08680 [Streptomyces sp. P3]